VSQELSHASAHLDLLSLCSYDNGDTKDLYAKLQAAFNEIREVAVSPVYCQMREARVCVKGPLFVRNQYGDSVVETMELSKTIVEVTRQIRDILREALVLKR
jgi:hypothetical protein